MGNSNQKPEKTQLSSQEILIIQNKFKQFKGFEPCISPRLASVLIQCASHDSRQIHGWVHLASCLTRSSMHDWKEFAEMYIKMYPGCSGKEFIQDVGVSAMKVFDGAYTAQQLSQKFFEFLIESTLTNNLESDEMLRKKQEFQHDLTLDLLFHWFSTSHYLKTLWDILFHHLFFDKIIAATPTPGSSLIASEEAFVLYASMEPTLVPRHRWRLSYSSLKDGKSWTVFTDKIKNSQVSLIVIKDKKGFVFGGVGCEPWAPQPLFFGNSNSFLFSLSPSLKVYKPSGLNNNYQYFETGTKTMTNGLGFGGQVKS
jgi:hypothetical protein